MARDIDPENSEVRNLIVNTLQAEERAALDSEHDSSDMSQRLDCLQDLTIGSFSRLLWGGQRTN